MQSFTNLFTQFAAETPSEDAGLFGALGIDWQLLIVQIIAFLVLVALLGKFVYPWLMKQVDERQANIEKAAAAASEAQKAAAQSQEEVASLLAEARKEAADVVETAKLEAAEIMQSAEVKAKTSAERIVADAHTQIGKDIAAAKAELHDETLALVAMATEKLIGVELTASIDDARIAKALKESR